MTFDLERARGLRDFLQDDCAEVGDVWGEMIAEIERLRGYEIAARDLSADLTKVAGARDEQAARIEELEADVLQKSILCGSLAENCNGLRDRAWKAEGKIGSSDHSSDVTKKVWQITEERKATLAAALKVLERLRKVNTDTDHSYLYRGITVLRTMLTEAE